MKQPLNHTEPFCANCKYATIDVNIVECHNDSQIHTFVDRNDFCIHYEKIIDSKKQKKKL